MNFSNVKLVVSDMDGTLLNPKSEVSARFFQLFNQLKNQNIHFVAASGRQYHSILEKLHPIKQEISIIAENGAMMSYNNEEHILLTLTKEDISKAIHILRPLSNTFIVLCGRKTAYIETTDAAFIAMFQKYYSEYELVEDITKVTNDVFLKIAVYHFESTERFVLPYVDALNSNLQVIISGENWLDISHASANKGYALNILQKKLGVTKEETMAFGDYNNDLQMLELAHFSFAMENAHDAVKNIARFKTKSNAEAGVEAILEQLINAKIK